MTYAAPRRLSSLASGLLWLTLVVFAAPGRAAGFESPSDGVYKDRIEWGAMLDMSGPVSSSQAVFFKGIQAYLRKVNEAGGIHGRKINITAEDDRFDPAVDRINFEKLVGQTPVLGISGLGNSAAQGALLSAIKRGDVAIVGSYTNIKAMLEPAHRTFYSGACGFRETAQVAVGFFTEKLKLKAPKVATVVLETGAGAEYSSFVQEAVAKLGGTAKSFPIKVTAIDANAQVREIIAMKPDFVAFFGGVTSAILVARTLQQFGVNVPIVSIVYQGTPAVYAALGPEAGKNYFFMSCVTPASADRNGEGAKDLAAAADRYGFGALEDDVNFVQGWVVGQTVAAALAKVGPEPTRAKLVETMNAGFEVDSKGLSSPIRYTKDDHRGPFLLRPYSYDFASKTYKAHGKYSDYEKFLK